MKEKYVSDDSEAVEERMRGLKRFLENISQHQILSQSDDFNKFMKELDFPTEVSSKESSVLEEDTSTVSKYLYSIYESVKSKFSGTESTMVFKNKIELDFTFEKHLQKLKSLLAFMEKLHDNGEKLRELLSKETENCRNIRSVIGNLQSSIKDIDIDQTISMDDCVNDVNAYEEEKNIPADDDFRCDKSQEIRQSVEIIAHESSISNDVYDIVVKMEEGIGFLSAGIDAIERRCRYKRAFEVTTEDIQKLNSQSNEPSRESQIKEEKKKQLERDILKIDENLIGEIDVLTVKIEKCTSTYICELIKVRKNHMVVQKDHWKKIAATYAF
eukprot:CAMPEP_0168346182 /NCGR_PEP_ID=MMETSP0213-20121227/18091_1 /TAXON_ID=151035 /ORGANISM="Euplotes harpa, Strain FSP1.4" /LENGTH=327 /DNA_ID=CAMNT_0008354729 /DNA_START=298 /DNA_END=1281 /DNA_ORIENTATION=-